MKRREIILSRSNSLCGKNHVSVLLRRINAITITRGLKLSKAQTYFETRNLCIYILREKHGMTQKSIGRIFNIDHSTVYYLLKKVNGFVAIDKHYCEDYREILELL